MKHRIINTQNPKAFYLMADVYLKLGSHLIRITCGFAYNITDLMSKLKLFVCVFMITCRSKCEVDAP